MKTIRKQSLTNKTSIILRINTKGTWRHLGKLSNTLRHIKSRNNRGNNHQDVNIGRDHDCRAPSDGDKGEETSNTGCPRCNMPLVTPRTGQKWWWSRALTTEASERIRDVLDDLQLWGTRITRRLPGSEASVWQEREKGKVFWILVMRWEMREL